MGAQYSSILEAASYNDFKKVREQLASGKCDPRDADGEGWTVLHIAAWKGYTEVAKEYLASGHGPLILNAQDKKGNTPLHLAASQDHPEIVFLLVCAGAEERPNQMGLLPTHKAAFSGAAQALDVLLAHSDSRHANAALSDGMAPLHLAAWKGDAECISLLLRAGGGSAAVNNKGMTPLHEAAAAGQLPAVKELLKECRGRATAQVLDNEGKKPIDLARRSGHDGVVMELEAVSKQGNGGIFGFIGRIASDIGLSKSASGSSGGRGDGWEEAGPRDWDGQPIRPPEPLYAQQQQQQQQPRDHQQQKQQQAQRQAVPQAAAAGPESHPVSKGEADLDWGAPPTYQDDGWGNPTGAAAPSAPPQPRSGPSAPPRAPPPPQSHRKEGYEEAHPTPSTHSGPSAPPPPAPQGHGKEGYEEAPPELSAPGARAAPGTGAVAGAQPMRSPGADSGSAQSLKIREEMQEKDREIEELRAQLSAVKMSSGSTAAGTSAAAARGGGWSGAAAGPFAPPPSCQMFSKEELEAATGGFAEANKIGSGGYGEVYRGMLRNYTRVAVKRLNREGLQGSEELWREVNVLSRVRHQHVVLLLGACPDEGCLVYELMEGGSLEDALCHRRPEAPPLEWHQRVRIAAEMATALLVLHQAVPEPILHRDFKPANVLLDAHLTAKLADVGLARLAPELASAGRTHVQDSRPVGTLDYIDPEYLHTGRFAPGSDTYSLGVSLLQLLSGRQPRGADGRTLFEWVSALLRANMIHDAVDATAIRRSRWPLEDAQEFARLAVRCCAYKRADRPALIEAVDTLRGLVARAQQQQQQEEAALRGHSGAVASAPPSMFICPITQEVMEDPVVAGDGFTYERRAIEQWFATGRRTSPMSNAALRSLDVTPNYIIRSAVHEWRSGSSSAVAAAAGGGGMYPAVAPMPSAPPPPF